MRRDDDARHAHLTPMVDMLMTEYLNVEGKKKERKVECPKVALGDFIQFCTGQLIRSLGLG
jgi:hypothetical protein